MAIQFTHALNFLGSFKKVNMNYITKQVMSLLKIDAETAIKVQDEMMASGFDFSEITQKAFNREAKICFVVIQALESQS